MAVRNNENSVYFVMSNPSRTDEEPTTAGIPTLLRRSLIWIDVDNTLQELISDSHDSFSS